MCVTRCEVSLRGYNTNDINNNNSQFLILLIIRGGGGLRA